MELYLIKHQHKLRRNIGTWVVNLNTLEEAQIEARRLEIENTSYDIWIECDGERLSSKGTKIYVPIEV